MLPLVVCVIIISGCDADSGAGDGDLSAEGVVVDVRGTITAVEEFDLLLSDGERLTLAPQSGALERSGFSPAHLREHMAIAEPISVAYRAEDGRNVMTGVGDAGE